MVKPLQHPYNHQSILSKDHEQLSTNTGEWRDARGTVVVIEDEPSFEVVDSASSTGCAEEPEEIDDDIDDNIAASYRTENLVNTNDSVVPNFLDGGDWCDATSSASIAIPSFLQPLLGMEYLPYLTSFAQSFQASSTAPSSSSPPQSHDTVPPSLQLQTCTPNVLTGEEDLGPDLAVKDRPEAIVSTSNKEAGLSNPGVPTTKTFIRPAALSIPSMMDDMESENASITGHNSLATPSSLDGGWQAEITSVGSNNDNSSRMAIKDHRKKRGTPKLWNKIQAAVTPRRRHPPSTATTTSNPTQPTDQLPSSLERQLQIRNLVQKQQRQLEHLEQTSQHVQQRVDDLKVNLNTLQGQALQFQQSLQDTLQSLERDNLSLVKAQDELRQVQQQADVIRADMLQALRQHDNAADVPSQAENRSISQQQAQLINRFSQKRALPERISRRRSLTEDDRRYPLETPPLVCNTTTTRTTSSTEPTTATTTTTSSPFTRDGSATAEAATSPTQRPRANSDTRVLRKSSSSLSFMRVADLPDVKSATGGGLKRKPNQVTPVATNDSNSGDDAPFKNDDNDDQSSLSYSVLSLYDKDRDDFYWLDENLSWALEKLWNLAWSVVTDESDRFRLASGGKLGLHQCTMIQKEGQTSPHWTIVPWHQPVGDHVLLWVGDVHHKGHGHDWPVVKARGVIHCSPRQLVEFLLDSSQVSAYNKMSQGRTDVNVIQESLDSSEDESPYGVSGAVKITRSMVKPRLLPKTIETLSLWHAKRCDIESTSPEDDTYMIVNRSVWEDAPSGKNASTNLHERGNKSWSSASSNNNLLRSEMLLGVFLCRPYYATTRTEEDEPEKNSNNQTLWCELTTITHVFPSGVPEMMAKRMAPSSASTMIQNIQTHFHTNSKTSSSWF